MEKALRDKFNNPRFAQLLLGTGDDLLVYSDDSHFWGDQNGNGEHNHMGKQLMDTSVRSSASAPTPKAGEPSPATTVEEGPDASQSPGGYDVNNRQREGPTACTGRRGFCQPPRVCQQ